MRKFTDKVVKHLRRISLFSRGVDCICYNFWWNFLEQHITKHLAANIYFFKISNIGTTKRCKICSKLTCSMSMTSFCCFYCEIWTVLCTFFWYFLTLNKVNNNWVWRTASVKILHGKGENEPDSEQLIKQKTRQNTMKRGKTKSNASLIKHVFERRLKLYLKEVLSVPLNFAEGF